MALPIIQFSASCFLRAHADLFVSEALTRGVTNTADRGYKLDAADRLDAGTPRSFPAKRAKLQITRHRVEGGPITLFPCEITPGKGRTSARRWAGDDCVRVNSPADRIASHHKCLNAALASNEREVWTLLDEPSSHGARSGPPDSQADESRVGSHQRRKL
jgi:hypothetical protein